MRYLLILQFSFFIFLSPSDAVTISGKITAENGDGVPFVSVYIKGTTIGTTANVEGAYSLEAKAGEYEIMFRSIGYKLHSEKISVHASSIVLNVILSKEAYELKEALINASAEDPAYAIIRKAQGKRKHYLNQVDSYSCSAYMKSVQRITAHPKKILGQEVDLSEVLDSTTGIIYLSESVSKLSFKKPDHIKEEMVSSKVSGNNRSFSFNQASDILFNFYNNLVDITGLTKRGIVSPISVSAMMYYDYKLEGTFIENGETINKIKVIPKRKHDPVFTGDIYIMDDSWRIHSLDLFITKDQQLEFIDTFRFKQVYVPLEKEVWMPFNSEFSFVFGGSGFHGRGVIEGIISNYNLHPDFPPHFFDGEVMKINRDANKKDSTYWKDTRTVPLTGEESKDYVKRDSTFRVHETKEYRDSIDRKRNKFKPGEFFLGGYGHENSFNHSGYFVSGLLNSVQFNTVEGLAIDVNGRYSKRLSEEDEDRRRVLIDGSVRYGFSNQHWNGQGIFTNRYSREHLASYSLSAGSAVTQFNGAKPISEVVNTSYTLFDRRNYMKIYEKRFGHAQQSMEVSNGIFVSTAVEYADRSPLFNTTNYSFSKNNERLYSSNDPLNPETDSLHFNQSKSFTFDARVRVRIKQQYLTRPQGKFIIGSKYPDITFAYRKAIADVFQSDADYDFASATISDQKRFGLFGGIQYSATYGKFLSHNSMQFMDWHHFNGNQTFLSDFKLRDFLLLDYYTASTNDEYLEAHGEYNFGGFILNKIPGIRQLKLSEIAGIHYFRTPFMKNYFETSFGLEKLGFIRADFVMSFTDGRKVSAGFVFGLKVNVSGGGVSIEL